MPLQGANAEAGEVDVAFATLTQAAEELVVLSSARSSTLDELMAQASAEIDEASHKIGALLAEVRV